MNSTMNGKMRQLLWQICYLEQIRNRTHVHIILYYYFYIYISCGKTQ